VVSILKVPSLKPGPMSEALRSFAWSSTADGAFADEEDDELSDDELLEAEAESLVAATFFLLPLSRPNNKKAPSTRTAAATTPMMIFPVLLDDVPGGGPGGGPGGTRGTAMVAGADRAWVGCVTPAW
jgi:hypothetical protein